MGLGTAAGRAGQGVAILWTLILMAPMVAESKGVGSVFQGLDFSERDEGESVSVLIETGTLTPSIHLMDLSDSGEVSLQILKGEAEFLYSQEGIAVAERRKRVRYRSDSVYLPPLFAGENDLTESFLEISVDGVPIGDPIRISTLESGYIERFWLGTRTLQPAILWLDDVHRAVIVDPRRIALEELEGDTEELGRQEEAQEGGFSCDATEDLGELRSEVGCIEETGDFRCPVLVWLRPKPSDQPFRANLCLSNLKISGSVEFVSDSPTAGFSIKPETGTLLFRPTTFIVNLLDGLYRSSWGCNVALKIPGNVVARVFGVDASCCRGVLAAGLGLTCTWVDPATPPEFPDWPVCPL